MTKNFREAVLEEMKRIGVLDEAHDFSNRVEYTDLIKFLEENNFQNGKFVSLGYYNSVDVKLVYPSQQSLDKANTLMDKYPNEPWKNKLHDMVTSQAWQHAQNGERSEEEKKNKIIRNIQGHLALDNPMPTLISFDSYSWNWLDRNSVAKAFGRHTEEEKELRRRFGFGYDEDSYPETDWHRRVDAKGNSVYGGTGIMRQVKSSAGIGTYLDDSYADYNLWGDTDAEGNPRHNEEGEQKLVMRQVLSSPKQQRHSYFIVIDNKLMSVPDALHYYLKNDTKAIKAVQNAQQQLSQDEAEFKKELDAMKKNHQSMVKQWDTKKIAFIVATVIDEKTKQKKRVYYINDKPQLENVDPAILHEFTIQQLNLSAAATDEEAEKELNP